MGLADALKALKESFNFRKEVTVRGIKFELSVLTHKDEQEVSELEQDENAPVDGIAFFNESRKRLLSYSIRKINEEEIPDIVEIEENGKKKTVERQIYVRGIIDGIGSKLSDKLFDAYVDLKEESDADIDKSTEYEWFRTPEERERLNKEKLKKAQMEGQSLKEEATENVHKEEESEFKEIKIPEEDKASDS